MSLSVDSVTVPLQKEVELALKEAGIRLYSIELEYGRKNEIRNRRVIYRLDKKIIRNTFDETYQEFQKRIRKASQILVTKYPKKYKDVGELEKGLMGRLLGEYKSQVAI